MSTELPSSYHAPYAFQRTELRVLQMRSNSDELFLEQVAKIIYDLDKQVEQLQARAVQAERERDRLLTTYE